MKGGSVADSRRENRGLTLRLRAGQQHFAFPLTSVEAVAGYARLGAGEWEATPAFAGWLAYRGTEIPVYDLGVHLGQGEKTPRVLSSRIMIFSRLHDSNQRVGLLAAEITDTFEERELDGAPLLQAEPLLRDLLGETA